jgi:predicted O-methyltransferase YrrM
VRGGGLILIDNTLWSGDVANPSVQDAETKCIRELNEKVRDDTRVQSSFLSIGDGLMLAWKRPV